MAVKINSFPTVKPKSGDIVTGLQSGENVNFETSELGSIPIGTDREVLGYENGESKALRLGWKQLSDMPSPPDFSNGVLTGTAFNPNGSALFAFVKLNTTNEPLGTSIPMADQTGALPTAHAGEPYHAVNLGQLNSRIPLLPTVDGEYLLKITNNVAIWVLKS